MCDAEKHQVQVASLASSHALASAGATTCAHCGQYLFLRDHTHSACLAFATASTAATTSTLGQTRRQPTTAPTARTLCETSLCISASTCGRTSNATDSSTQSSPQQDTNAQPTSTSHHVDPATASADCAPGTTTRSTASMPACGPTHGESGDGDEEDDGGGEEHHSTGVQPGRGCATWLGTTPSTLRMSATAHLSYAAEDKAEAGTHTGKESSRVVDTAHDNARLDSSSSSSSSQTNGNAMSAAQEDSNEPPQLMPPHPCSPPRTGACSPECGQLQVQHPSRRRQGAEDGSITEANIPLSDAQFACKAITLFMDALCTLNASEPVPSSDFHSYCVPPMTVELYVERILRYCKCSAEALLCGFMLLLKYSFYSGHPVNIYNAHRLLITSTVLGIKMRDDTYYSNLYYARIGGIGGKEMNKLEVLFLSKLNWQLEVTPYEYAEMLTLLHALVHPPTTPPPSENDQHEEIHPSPPRRTTQEQHAFWERHIAPWLTRLQQACLRRDAEHAKLRKEDWQREVGRWRRYLAEEYAEAVRRSHSPSRTSHWTSPQSMPSTSTGPVVPGAPTFLMESEGAMGLRYVNFDHQHPVVYHPGGTQTVAGGRAGPATAMASACHTNNRFGFANFFGQYSSATYRRSPTKPVTTSPQASNVAGAQNFGILHRTSDPAASSSPAVPRTSLRPSAPRPTSVTTPGSGININAQPYYYTASRRGATQASAAQSSPPAVSANNPALRTSNWSSPTTRRPGGGQDEFGDVRQPELDPTTSRIPTTTTETSPSSCDRVCSAEGPRVGEGVARTSLTFPSVPPRYAGEDTAGAPAEPAKPVGRVSNAGKKRPKPANYNDYYQ